MTYKNINKIKRIIWDALSDKPHIRRVGNEFWVFDYLHKGKGKELFNLMSDLTATEQRRLITDIINEIAEKPNLGYCLQ